MDKEYFSDTDEFLQVFQFDGTKFYDPVHLTDRKVAFSIKRNYPDDIRYKPAVSQKSGKPDNVAVIWVIYQHPDEARNSADKNRVPVRVRVSNMSLFLSNHFDYDFDDRESQSPSKESYEQSISSPAPIELEYYDEYFFNHERNIFIDTKGNELVGVELLDRVFQDHCDTVHLLKGLKLRTALAFRNRTQGFLSLFITLLELILKKFFGRTLEENDMMAGNYKPYSLSALKKLETDSLNIFGYKASKNVIIVFCFLVIGSTIAFYNAELSFDYIKLVSGSEFLSLLHAILFLWILDVVTPLFIFRLINVLIKIKAKLLFG